MRGISLVPPMMGNDDINCQRIKEIYKCLIDDMNCNLFKNVLDDHQVNKNDHYSSYIN